MSSLHILHKGHEPILSRDGKIYCSPRCGFNCTKAEFDEATEDANSLAALMGDGWTPNVWENWGWNYSVIKGRATIYPSFDQSQKLIDYHVDLRVGERQILAIAEKPDDALGFAVQIARTEIQRMSDDLADLLD